MNCFGSTSHFPSCGIIIFKQLIILGLGKLLAYLDSHTGQSAVCSFPSGPREEGEERETLTSGTCFGLGVGGAKYRVIKINNIFMKYFKYQNECKISMINKISTF